MKTGGTIGISRNHPDHPTKKKKWGSDWGMNSLGSNGRRTALKCGQVR